MKELKRVFLYSILVILMFYVFLVDVNVEGRLAISAFAQERETIFEGFDTQIDSFVDAMTDEKSGAIFVLFGPIYMAIYGHNDFTIWSYGNYINFAPDATHLIRVGGNKPFSLNYLDKRNALKPTNEVEAESVIQAIVKGEEINLRYYEDKDNRHNQVDSKLQNIFLGFVYCKAVKLFGWKDLGVSPELPPVKLNIYTPTDSDSKVEVQVNIQGNPDLMLTKDKGSSYASIRVRGIAVLRLNSNEEYVYIGNYTPDYLVIRDSNGIMVFKESLPIGPYMEKPDSLTMIFYGDTRWPEGETAVKKAWESAPLGSIQIEGIKRVSLYGFRELWKWGVDNLHFPSLGDDIQTGTKPNIGNDSSPQIPDTTISTVQPSSPLNGATLPPGNITFSWNPVSNATKYQHMLYHSLGKVGKGTVDTSSTSFTIFLGTEETITWKVRAGDNSGNWGPWSSTWSLTLKHTTTISTESSPQVSETSCSLEGSLHCPDKAGYTCPSCSTAPGYDNHFKGFNILTKTGDGSSFDNALVNNRDTSHFLK